MKINRDVQEHDILRRENLRARFAKANLKGRAWAEIEQSAGLGDGTVRKFANGSTEQPSLLTLLKISAAMTRKS